LEGVPLVGGQMEAEDSGRQPNESLEKLPYRILLAEDMPDNQRLIAAILRRTGAEVTIVGNGQEAMVSALATHPEQGPRIDDSREPFDVVLMDMQMPVLDGYEATRRLRHEGYARPIIALTAHSMRGDREKCIAAGCDDYLSKPVNREDLIKMVAKWATPLGAQTEAVVAERLDTENLVSATEQ
jgi:CheY-like chemotaxis protein